MTRNIFFSILTVLVLATAGWLYYSIRVAGVKTQALEAQLQEINGRFNELSMVSDSYDEFKLKFNEKLAAFDTLKSIIPDNQMYADVLESIRKIAERHKLQIISMAPTLVDIYPPLYRDMKLTSNHIECYPLQFKFYGDFLTIGAFLDDLRELKTKVNIASLKLETEMEHGGMLTCELNLYTYIFIEGA